MSEATTTTDHDEIRKWVEARKGRPSRVKTSGKGGLLRIDFGDAEDELEEALLGGILRNLRRQDLAFLHQDKVADGKTSRFNKFVSREKS